MAAGLLEGKVAIITGAGRGIGRADALLFAEHGASVVVNDLNEDPAQEVVEEIKKMGGQAIACAGSVADIEFPDKIMKATSDAFGKLDILVNNAGFTWDSVIQNMTDEQWYAIIDCHLTAPFRLIRAATPLMREVAKKEMAEGKLQQRKIINISSTSGVAGNPGQVNYSAAKLGIVGLTKTMAKEWGRFGINVNSVAYGFIETRLTQDKEQEGSADIGEGRSVAIGIPQTMRDAGISMIPLGRAGTPNDAAGPVLFLASPLSDYVSGVCILCTGGSYC